MKSLTAALLQSTAGLFLLFATTSIQAQSALTPVGGLWTIVGEDGPGRGFQIEVQNDTLVMTTYGYEDSGDARFWLAAGSLVPGSNQITMELGAYEGGMAFGDPLKNATYLGSEGNVTLKFENINYGQICLPNEACKPFRPLNFGFGKSASALLGSWLLVELDSETNLLFAWNFNFTEVVNTANPAIVDRAIGTSLIYLDGISYDVDVVCSLLVDTTDADFFCELQLLNGPVIEAELRFLRNALVGQVYDPLGVTIDSTVVGWRIITGGNRLVIPN